MNKVLNNFLIRMFDLLLSIILIIILLPLCLAILIIIFSQDYKNPLYIANRVGLNNQNFKMLKIRTMIFNAEKSGVDSTADDDMRITNFGRSLRKFKLDEIPQLVNVLLGQMSFVGPRPNVIRETSLYSKEEQNLLSVRPGITDFASICFSDEGEILKGSNNPDLDYNQLIRPGKNYLGLFYIENRSLRLNLYLIIITAVSIISKSKSRELIANILNNNGASKFLIDIAKRENKLKPMPPPGMNSIVMKRENIN